MQPTLEPAPDGSECGNLNLLLALSVTLPDVVVQNHHKWAHPQVAHDQAREIERETQDQASSSKWHEERLTASTFGCYMTRKAPISEKFLESIFMGKSFSSAATSYGTCNEKTA